MSKKVLIVDTCLACVWMRVPEMEVAESDNDCWDYNRVNTKIEYEIAEGTLLVLPLASIIETGNHITHIKRRDRMPYVMDFGEKIQKSIDGDSPWAAFSSQNALWEGNHLRDVVGRWVSMNKTGKHSFGDVSILDVATAYRAAGFQVEILTADSLLKSYETVDLQQLDLPAPPRRRRNKN